jgi:hypothetical protein
MIRHIWWYTGRLWRRRNYSYLLHVTNQTHEHITTSVKIKGEPHMIYLHDYIHVHRGLIFLSWYWMCSLRHNL